MTLERADETTRSSRMLVATDFSEASARARDYAIALAAPGDEMVILHVHPLPLPDWPDPPYVPEWMPSGPSVRGAHVERLREFAEPARAAGLKVKTALEEGLAADVILGRAASLPPDLIVLGTGRRGGFGGWMMGSTAERVVRRARVPVLTVPAEASHPARGIRGILCAVDFAGEGTLDAARRLARRCGSTLTVLHVVDAPIAGAPNERRRRAAERRLAATLAEGRPGPADGALLRVGRAGREIVAAARERAVDVIVVGLRDPGRWAPELTHVGSTAARVLREAPCAVLTVSDAAVHLAIEPRGAASALHLPAR